MPKQMSLLDVSPGKAPLDFEEAYRLYPRKRGKQRGIKIAVQTIKTRDRFQELLRAVLNYAQECATENREARYIMHFSTFMGCWEDWIDPECEAAPEFDIGQALERRGKE